MQLKNLSLHPDIIQEDVNGNIVDHHPLQLIFVIICL